MFAEDEILTEITETEAVLSLPYRTAGNLFGVRTPDLGCMGRILESEGQGLCPVLGEEPSINSLRLI
jgi:hypothetical protein